jgi:hypothetical protein
MHPLRKVAGVLMLASTATHLSEPFIFPFSLPLVVATLYEFCFLAIGVFLFKEGTRVLWWGAVLPLSAAFLGTGNAILEGYMPGAPGFGNVRGASRSAKHVAVFRRRSSVAPSVWRTPEHPYGDRRAMIRDRWGDTWQIATHGGRFTP